ncbi:MAG: UTP--glucose-1-phosphate uridylyltransferase [Ignavibacteriales bacterium]|nr:UTP--glucose-1-phosphate uridylyltransferase [Ignavibacteriales bacterium]
MPNSNFELFKSKMKSEQLPEIVIDNFNYYYNQLINGESGMLAESEILPVDNLESLENLSDNYQDQGNAVLQKSVLIKLNGGLGTSMGLSEAKSLLKIKNEFTFLDIIAKQTEYSKTPLVLMNSFNTQKKSLELLNKYSQLKSNIPLDFLQHKIPKICAETYKPISYSENSELEWCPPGHGEIYTALVTSGMLRTLLENNIEYAFISNSDNLGAAIDLKILGYVSQNNFPFLMEVADRTEADKKGGHLAKLSNGQLILREAAQCPENDINDFQNIQKHKYFNTNNIWINLKALKKLMEENNNILGLPMIVNKKTVNPREPKSAKVFQLETAMGSAISTIKSATALVVPRTRFAPVKTTEDLLAVRSDNYILTEDFRVVVNPERKLKPLKISLDSNYYKLVDDLDNRIPNPPSLVQCEELTIKGNFKFGSNIKIVGKVKLENLKEIQEIIRENTTIQ